MASLVFLFGVTYATLREYRDIKNAFRKINAAVLDHSMAESLVEIMRRYGYEPFEFVDAIKSNDSQIIAEKIRNFARYMHDYEEKRIKNNFRYFTFMLILVLVAETCIYLFFRKAVNSLTVFQEKIFRVVRDMYESLYIDKITRIHPEVYQEEAVMNELVEEANLRDDIIRYFRTLPYVDTVEDYIKVVGEQVCSFFRCGRFSLALISGEDVIAEIAYFTDAGQEVFLDKGFSQKLAETSLEKMIKEGTKYRIIDDLRLVNSKSSALIVKEGFLSNLTVPAIVNDEVIGFFFLSAAEPNHFNDKDGILFHIVSLILSPKLYHTLALQHIIANFGGSLVNLAEYRDNETGNHIKRVSLYSKILAEALKLEPRLVREIYQFAPLHDIGKIGIPDEILFKPGKLDEAEWERMKQHVEIGVRILESFAEKSREVVGEQALKTAINIVREHHEKWDGSGYPLGKKGEEISIEARIVALADVFDALTTRRPYKNAFSFEESVKILEEQSGKHFDPAVVRAFMKDLDKINAVYNELRDAFCEDTVA
ncbi:HD-GYP domain-containing protein [Pseudothermotoga sp. U03pept]|uniref:HD-GYP domain-containing protein n=1 Tax=Pseudothermotoga sp. U03pept TaxID=3447012 RepID=UPI003F018F41